MLLNKNKILIAGVVGGIAVAVPDMAKAQTFYQCMPMKCADGYFWNGFGCTQNSAICDSNQVLGSDKKCHSTDSSNWTLLYDKKEGDKSNWIDLDPGVYAVSLKGGAGGGAGSEGGTVTYMFTEKNPWILKFAVGTSGSENQGLASGGGGSWIAIDNQYIVAGGGGGFGQDWTQSGAGGAVGGGSSAFTGISNYDCSRANNWYTYAGGASGDYKGGWYNSTCERCIRYTEDMGGDDYNDYACYPGEGINNANGGQCAPTYDFSKRYDRSPQVAQGGSAEGILLYPGFGNIKVGGDAGSVGLATHTTNLKSINGCAGQMKGCMKLYKFKY